MSASIPKMLQAYPTERFNAFIPFILKEECNWPKDQTGQYSNTPGDSGGPTKFGIDLRGQQTYDPNGEWTEARIKALTVDKATGIFWYQYWLGHTCDSLPPKLGECAMNTWVNGGHVTQWLNTCDGSAARYIELMEAWYRRIGVGHNRQFLPDWLGRSERLKAYLGL